MNTSLWGGIHVKETSHGEPNDLASRLYIIGIKFLRDITNIDIPILHIRTISR